MPSSPTTQIDQRRTSDESVGARLRRRIATAVTVLVLAALIGPSAAGAVLPQEVDENGNNNTPAGSQHPECEECPDPEDYDGPVTTTTETVDWTYESHDCTWLVTGRLVVRNPTADGVADRDPIEGVEVKVSGRAWAGLYNDWGTDTTNADGEFSVSETECSDRKVKVEAKFESDDLRVKGPSSPSSYLLYESDGTIDPSDIELNGEPFGPGFSAGDQGSTQARTDAQTWIVYRKALDYLDDIGYASLNDLTVHNPASLAPSGSWADPILHDIHISPAHTASLDTMLHELGHHWMYPREIGEGCLTTAISDGSTHDLIEKPCVAFNEGVSNFFSNKLEQEMNTAGLITSSESTDSTKPMNRAELIFCTTCDDDGLPLGLVSLSRVETNEYGWDQVFRVLTSSDITRQLFGPGYGDGGLVSTYNGPSCGGRGMPVNQDDLADALRVIGDSSDKIDLQDSDDPSVADLFDRADDRLAGFDLTDSIAYLNTVDPTSDSEPHEAYGC